MSKTGGAVAEVDRGIPAEWTRKAPGGVDRVSILGWVAVGVTVLAVCSREDGAIIAVPVRDLRIVG